jgi:hypothetical protein
MFILSSQVDYNHHRSSVGGLVGYGNSSNQQQRSSTYFGEELFDESKSESVQQDTFYGIYVYIKIHAKIAHIHYRE